MTGVDQNQKICYTKVTIIHQYLEVKSTERSGNLFQDCSNIKKFVTGVQQLLRNVYKGIQHDI